MNPKEGRPQESIVQISYSLTEEDIISLTEFRIERSGVLKKTARTRQIIYPLAFGLIAVGSFLTSNDLNWLVVFGLLAIFSFFFVPPFYTWLYRRRIPQRVRSKMTTAAVGPRTATAEEDGVHMWAGELYSEIPWNLVTEVAETPARYFVAIDGQFIWAIPRREVDEAELNRFVTLLREKIEINETSLPGEQVKG